MPPTQMQLCSLNLISFILSSITIDFWHTHTAPGTFTAIRLISMMNYSIIEPVQVEIMPTQGTFLHLPTVCIKLTIMRLTTDESAFLALFIISSIPAAMRKGFYSTFRKYLAVLTGYRLKNIHRSTSYDFFRPVYLPAFEVRLPTAVKAWPSKTVVF